MAPRLGLRLALVACLELFARLLDRAQDAQGAACLRDRTCLLDERQRLITATLLGGDVGKANQIRGNAGQEPGLSAKQNRLLQPFAWLIGSSTLATPMSRFRCLGLYAWPGCEGAISHSPSTPQSSWSDPG